jgi:adenylate kinase family enzyme
MESIVGLIHGAPLSGKGHGVARVLADAGFVIISTSDLLQRHADQEVMRKVCDGELAADDLMISLLEAHWPASDRVAIDMLRSVKQVEWIRKRCGISQLFTCYLNVSEKTIHQRLALAPTTERGARADDQAILRRLEEYKRYSPAMLPVLENHTLFFKIDAERPVEEVRADVRRHIDPLILNTVNRWLFVEA